MKTIETVVLTTQKELRDTKHVEGVFFKCFQCDGVKPVQTNGGTGYGYDKDENPICYACCGENDKKQMRETGKAVLYLTTQPANGGYGDCSISNWPGSLKLTGRYHKGAHNIARTRYDVWFKFEGSNWHGVQYGENTQIVRCRKTK